MVLAFLYLKIEGYIGAGRDDRAELTQAELTQADLTQGRLDPHAAARLGRDFQTRPCNTCIRGRCLRSTISTLIAGYRFTGGQSLINR